MKLHFIPAILLALILVPQAALCSEQAKLQGYILDKQCADSVKDDSNPLSFIHSHTKDCALMRNCKIAGYGLYTGGKWLDLDKRGNQMAIKVLQESKRNSGFYVEVAGELHGKTLQVQSIKELEEPETKQEPAK